MPALFHVLLHDYYIPKILKCPCLATAPPIAHSCLPACLHAWHCIRIVWAMVQLCMHDWKQLHGPHVYSLITLSKRIYRVNILTLTSQREREISMYQCHHSSIQWIRGKKQSSTDFRNLSYSTTGATRRVLQLERLRETDRDKKSHLKVRGKRKSKNMSTHAYVITLSFIVIMMVTVGSGALSVVRSSGNGCHMPAGQREMHCDSAADFLQQKMKNGEINNL